ncbi:MAG: NifX-associated nitrogen fixation protein [Pseudomonadota bacterium]|nr:NifX-associated nitrogen fixation protein [Pseudomonadota bacterium]
MTEYAIAEQDPLLESAFVQELVKQIRALDTYGTYESYSAPRLLDPFILTSERKRQLPILGNLDAQTRNRIQVYYNSLAALIEQHTQLMAAPVITLSEEGFGRALIISGKLVVLDRNLRDAHRFGFKSLAKLQTEADKAISKAVELIQQYRQVAEL